MKIITAILVSLVLALGGTAYGLWQRQVALAAQNKTLTEAAERAVEREKQDRKVLVARQAEIASQARKLTQAQRSLSEALQRNKPWSDTDVPPDVQKALSGPSDGLSERLHDY
jgi:uncharacterized protein HemX